MIITKNGTDEITPEYDILYIVRTSFLDNSIQKPPFLLETREFQIMLCRNPDFWWQCAGPARQGIRPRLALVF